MNKFEWLSRLVAFDTTSRNSNLELIACIKDWLSQHHVPFRVSQDATGQKANLFATLQAAENETKGGIILSGHTDVVPVDDQQWKTPPFVATQVKDKIYGRGTSDMKGFIAVVLALVPFFQKIKLSVPVHLAFSYDEEVGCLGARVLIEDLRKTAFKPAACIVGEPTNMKVVTAHKGIQVFRCRVTGKAGHSSLTPQGCNAIEHAAAVIQYIRALAEEIRLQGPFDDHFDVPFTTISTNIIQGGTANNIIPSVCEFIFEFRNLPIVNPKSILDKIKNHIQNEVLPKMQREYTHATFAIENAGMAPSFAATDNIKITQLAQSISGNVETHKVAYATEAGLFQAADIPTIICGPGSIEQAHRPDEYITVEQLEKCEEFLQKIVREFN